MKTMHVTQKEIAERLGVSRQLVTHALNGMGTISEQKRREVLEAAEEMGYRRNELARAMVTGKSSTLGFLSQENDQTDHLMRVLAGAIDTANNQGYFIRAMHNSKADDIRGVLEQCIEWRVSGLMVMNLRDEVIDRVESEVKRLKIPVAFVDSLPKGPADVCVRSDDYDGFRQVIEHLAALGHRKIAFFNGEKHSRLTQAREAHFVTLMKEAGLPVNPEWMVYSSWGGDNSLIERAAAQLLSLTPRPTAVVCAGDPFAMVMIRAAQNAGMKLPYELSITGFANFFLSDLTNPALTTVDQAFRAMGRQATENLIALSTRGAAPNQDQGPGEECQFTPTQLIVRGSTAPPAH